MDSIADEAVVATNDDAAVCKYQASLMGYYKDPYIEYFLTARIKNQMPRKAPEINRGYYARSTSIAYIVEKFIECYPDGQIISLGAGYDTLFWRLNEKMMISGRGDGGDGSERKGITYVEVDMSPVVLHKILSIRRNSILHRPLKDTSYKGEGMHSKNYHLIAFDLRQVDKRPLEQKLLEECELDPNRPTLSLSECIFVYMPTPDSSSLIKWLATTFTRNSCLVNYEQCNMADKFAEIMMANMNARHCDLMGVEACKTLGTQMDRLKANGLIETKGWTLLEILKECLPPASIERIFSLEFLDEQELLEQLMEHYCIVIGSNKPIDWMPENEYWLSKSTT